MLLLWLVLAKALRQHPAKNLHCASASKSLESWLSRTTWKLSSDLSAGLARGAASGP